MKTLVIVESPAKAGTITKILGKGYNVTSSFGHVRDLAKDGNKNTGVDIEDKYKPHYIITSDKKKVVDDLKRKVKTHDMVLLATDEDREGEAISWHLYEVLKLTKKNSKRITFTEITPHAIKSAVENPRDINIDLVEAQQARRILDRLVGFELTGLLWKKIRAQLSAGRVQSVAVRLLVDRERGIKNFKPVPYFKVTAQFETSKGQALPAELSERIKTEDDVQAFLRSCTNATFTVSAIEKKPSKRKPAAPFTTSTLQQLASQKLGFSVSRTMSTAQRLYEAGHITYMRTDSITLSNAALASIASFVVSEYGERYSTVRKYKTKSKNSQEAHEAIRPTYIDRKHVSDNPDQQKLYTLIRTRTLASQMADAEVEKTTITITISTESKRNFIANGEIVTFDGFLKAYAGTRYYSQEDVLLPSVEIGQKLTDREIQALERRTKPPTRYSEATLVKKLEELGIGRPSTYAPTIAKITSPTRGYITKETRDGEPIEYRVFTLRRGKVTSGTQSEITGAQKNKLFASDMGMVVTDFLCDHFKDVMDYAFTAEVEDKLDDIAQGKAQWVKIIDYYYKPFAKTVDITLEKADRATGERKLGKDPKSGRTVLVRISKYGPVAQIGLPTELKEDEKPTYANLLPSQSIETITMDDALKLFGLPKSLGKYKNEEIIVSRGRFGPYIKYGEHYISLGRDANPFAVKLNDAIEKVKVKLQELKPIADYQGAPITRGKGRFGPYIRWNDTFVAITKRSGIDFDSISKSQALELVKEKIKKDKEKVLHSWDDGAITIEKGRWGAIMRVKGKRGMIALPKGSDGQKMSLEDLKKMTSQEIKKALRIKK
jgi:DNA topoisomerase-1